MRQGRVVAIVQARMGSTRLPGKVLKEIMGKPLISYLIERLSFSQKINEVLIATSVNVADDEIEDYCKRQVVPIFRGSEADVLSRYLGAAILSKADFIVRICADSPLIDPQIVDEIIDDFLRCEPACDYLSNTINQTYPLGMNVEIFTLKALQIANGHALHLYEREHVTPYINQHPEIFSVIEKHHEPNLSWMRLTVDTKEDFNLVQLIFENLYRENHFFGLPNILFLLNKNPQLALINAHIKQKNIN